MINSNKILTVSYGTFSCTLEGFDDSFGTMKAIAEYFRDLSADDRYFGAEPAQPDAQMLARIAEREISRQVDAREDEGRIVLSARDYAQKTAPLAVQVADAAAAEAANEEAVAPDQEQTDHELADAAEGDPDSPAKDEALVQEAAVDTPTAVEEDAVAEDSVTEDSTDDIAEQESAEADVLAAQLDEATTDGSAQDVDADVTQVSTDYSDDAETDIVPSLPDAEVEAFFADSAPTDIPAQDVPADDLAEDIAAQEPTQDRVKADSIAEKLKRIRAVVSQQPEAEEVPDYSEDQHADANGAPAAAAMASIADEKAEADDETDMLSDTLRDIEDALDEDDTFEVEAADADLQALESDEDDDDDITAILSRLEDEADDEDRAYSDDDADFDDELDSYLDEENSADISDDTSDNILAAMEDSVTSSDTADNMFEAEAVAEAPAPAKKVAPAKPRARVLKVKRSTLEAAINSGQLEEYDDEVDAPEPRKAPLENGSTLSDEAEEELARELAELEADMQASKAGERAEVAPETETAAVTEPDDTSVEAARSSLDAGADESFSRLMEETEQQMEEPESTTRRDAFAHLRAAVAAKKADEAVGGSLGEEDSDEAYRDDLANVVRPRRPSSGDRPRTERPAEQRVAPLKLVAEQRIDTAEPRRVTPVRPRRVATTVVAPAPEAPQDAAATSFADFASEMGAEQLPDLLEAAAAYLSFVEGHDEFSRPQLMTKVRQVEKENFTREDGLRSFGKLLREGKIHKLSGGRFQASEQIGFKPDARAAS